MALRFYTNDGTVLRDLQAESWCDFKVTTSYSHAAKLEFTALVPQHEIPVAINDGVAFYDDDYAGGADPVFIGHCREVHPGDGPNVVKVVCYDPTYRASEEVFVTNGPGHLTTVTPRAVYCVSIDDDEDKGFDQIVPPLVPLSSPLSGFMQVFPPVRDVMADILDNQVVLLRNMWAAPASGAVPGAGSPYDATDISTWDMQSQEKFVFDSELVSGAIQRLMQLYPQFRMIFDPVARKWRFRKVTASPTATITLNEVSDHMVLSMQLDRQLDKRFGAIRIFGKPAVKFADVRVSAGTLTEFPVATGPNAGFCRHWQVTDPAKRHIARFIYPPQWVTIDIPNSGGILSTSYQLDAPLLLASWDGGYGFQPVVRYTFQTGNGNIFTPTFLWREDLTSSSSPRPKRPPDDVRFVFAYYTQPIAIRYPVSGFVGTAFTKYGISAERKVYHELLNTGYVRWDTVTSEYKIEHYTKLAEQAVDAYKDAVWTGGCTLRGKQYDYLRLDKRLCFAAVDANGAGFTTGWEDANAILTDCEIDYAANGEGTTTLTFSSDMAQFSLVDVETLRRVLNIRARANYLIRENFKATATRDSNGNLILSESMVREYLIRWREG